MTTESKTKRSFRRRAFIWSAIVLGVGAVLLGCFLFFLPNLVSSQWFRTLLEEKASEAVQRPVQIEELDWKWSDGFSLEKLRVADDPVFSDEPLISINEIRLDIAYGEILNGRLDSLFYLDGLNARVIRDKTGKTNVEKLLSTLAPPGPEKEEPPPDDAEKPPLSLPLDVKSTIDLKNISIFIDDRLTGEQYEVRNAAFRLDAPSVLHEPISLKASTRLAPGERGVLDFHLQATLRDLMDPGGVLAIHQMGFDVSGGLTGADFTAKGDLAKHRIHCGLSADLASVSRIPRIFLPPETPFPEIAGGLKIGADILGDPREKLTFDARVTCDNLVVSGGPVENGVIGPLDLNLTEKGEMDMVKGELTRHSGEFRIQEKSGARWTGAVSGLIPPPDADEQHTDIKLNLTSEIDPAEILQILAPLAPPDAPLPEAAGVIEIAVDLVG
ncbi:MAG: AsmA family protein, partial [Desulfobacterales bacterium]|nr:AsmA family protein [Desulfobacterales bacterium]